jgi:pimeloyl-ACP methyl ester carboxylesterase
MPGHYPIIYVRGFALRGHDIDETSDDPTNGFNVGTTHARQGRGQRVLKFRFPGPFIRLMTEHGYIDSIRGETDTAENLLHPLRTLWIYRYYEDYSNTYEKKGLDGRPDMEGLAWKLKKFIDSVIQKVYATVPEDIPRKVILVAHSMGGLICRSMIAQVLKADAQQSIAKVVTYGTPHAGIQLRGLSELPQNVTGFLSNVGNVGLNNFTHRHMFEYLNPQVTNDHGAKLFRIEYDAGFDLRRLQFFPPERFLCIVGTNQGDYEVAGGYWKHVVSPASDGLVKIENAWVHYAPRIDIHRSHSGRYGMVNSYEGYEETQRFLFGNWRATVDLVIDNPVNLDGGGARLLDVECSLGRRSLLLSARKAEHLNALDLAEDARVRIHVFHLLENDLETDEESDVERAATIRNSHFD